MFSKFVVCFAIAAGAVQAFAEENKASEGTQQVQTEVAPAVAAPKYVFGYNRYFYDLEGDKTATTKIYKFGKGSVDLEVYSATWLFSPKWTFVAVVPYIRNSVDTIYLPETAFRFKTTDKTEGLADVLLMGVSPLMVSGAHVVTYDLGLSLPTGSIEKKFNSNPIQTASYNMQTGSGTVDAVVGTTYTHTMGALVNSARGQVTVRGGKNASGWNLGNELQVKLSSKYQVTSWANVGFAGLLKSREKVNGRDAKYELANNFNAGGVSGDGHQYYHGAQTNIEADVVAKLQSPSWKGISASLEGGFPLWQTFMNKDEVDFNVNYWVAGTVTALF